MGLISVYPTFINICILVVVLYVFFASLCKIRLTSVMKLHIIYHVRLEYNIASIIFSGLTPLGHAYDSGIWKIQRIYVPPIPCPTKLDNLMNHHSNLSQEAVNLFVFAIKPFFFINELNFNKHPSI